MDANLSTIIDLVRKHQVVVVQAPTGAGKTIRIPQALLLEFPERMLHMTLPRRAAVRWCGKYMASEMGSRPGSVIGWRLYKEEPVMSAETRLLMTVDQSLANRIRRTGRLPEGIIIVDEAHERSVSTDLLLGLIKEALPNSPDTRLLITSATIDTEKFSAFFGGAPVVKTTSRQYDVEVHVRELFTGEHHSQAAISEARRVMEKYVQGQLTIAGELQGDVRQRVGQGTLIVLLPGKEDIANALRELSRQAEELDVLDRVEVLACHGETTPEDQDKVQSQVQDGVLRIVCGTEILRSSVTLPQVVGVIDSLQVKRNLVNERGVAHITKIAVSMAEADQAKGRAGRTGPGFYIPCSFHGEYGRLAPYPEPSIIREPTTSVALQVAAVGRSVRDFSFIDPPPPDKVEVAIGRLQAIGALDKEEKITDDGKLLVKFPIDPERAKALMSANQLGVLSEALVATAILEAEGIFHRPAKTAVVKNLSEDVQELVRSYIFADEWNEKILRHPIEGLLNSSDLPRCIKLRGDEYELDGQLIPSKEGMHVVADWVRKSWAGESRSDFVAMVNAYRAYKAEERRLWDEYPERHDKEQYNKRRSALKAWCFSHFLNIKRLQEAERLMFMLKDELTGTPLQMQNGLSHEREFDAEALTKALASGMVDRVARLELDRRYNGRMGEFSLAFQSVVGGGADLILAAQITKIPVKSRFTSHMLIGDLAAPLKAEWLEEVMPQLCWTKVVGEAEYEPKSDLVLHTASKRFQDMEYACAMVRVTDRLVAKSAFLRWIVGAIYQHHDGQIDNAEAQARIEQNGHVLDWVRDLNARHGCEVLPHSAKWVFETLSQQIGDATCVAELASLDDLVLPDPDKETVELILLDWPDTVEVAGQSLKVVYTTDRFDLQPPYVLMPEEILANPQLLPLEPPHLPNGKLVRMVAKFGWHDSSYDHPEHLKRDLIEYAHERALANYVPDIAIPDPEDETAVIPPIETRVFGENAFTGEPLEVYVYVAVRGDVFFAEKSGSWNVAEHKRDLAVVRFREVQRRAKDKRDMVQLKQKVDELGQQLLELAQEDALPDVLKQRMNDHRCSQSFLTVAEIRLWVTKAEGLAQEANVLISKARQAEEEKRVRELELFGISGEPLQVARDVAARAIVMLGQDEAEVLLLEASAGDYDDPQSRVDLVLASLQDQEIQAGLQRLLPRDIVFVFEAAFNLAVESKPSQLRNEETGRSKPDTSLASLFEFYGHDRGRG